MGMKHLERVGDSQEGLIWHAHSQRAVNSTVLGRRRLYQFKDIDTGPDIICALCLAACQAAAISGEVFPTLGCERLSACV